MKLILSVLMTLLLTTSLSFAQNSSPPSSQPDHYCDNEASWRQWEQILSDHPNDDAVSSLYAFRVGLCTMVKSGKIETQRATRLFERMREVVLKEIEEEEQNKDSQSL